MTKIYLISPPQIELENFSRQLKLVLQTEMVPVFQLRLKGYENQQIIHIAKELKKVCHDHNCLFLLNDSYKIALDVAADGVHLGVEDGSISLARQESRAHLKTTQGEEPLLASLSGSFAQLQDENFCKRITPYSKNSSSESAQNSSEIKARSFKTGSRNSKSFLIGASCYDSRHLAMEAGEQGADYLSFGAFFESKTKISRGKPTTEILSWCDELINLPTVAIGGITDKNCRSLVEANADFLAVISYVWDHPLGVDRAVKNLNSAITDAMDKKKPA